MPTKKPIGVAGGVMIVVSLCGIVALGAFLAGRQHAVPQKKLAGGKKVRKAVEEDAEPGFRLPDPVPDPAPGEKPGPADVPADPEIDMRPAEIPADDPPAPAPAPKAGPAAEKDEYAHLGRGPMKEVAFRVQAGLVHTKKLRVPQGATVVWMFHPISDEDEITFRRLDGDGGQAINLGQPVLKNGQLIRTGSTTIDEGVYFIQITSMGACGVRINAACFLEGQEGMPDTRGAVDVHLDDMLEMDIPGIRKKPRKQARKK